jgi:hypothetical protein
MAHLHLPVQHTDDDLAIAGALAQVLRCEELYVAWTSEGGPAEPVVPAHIHRPDEFVGHLERPRRRPGLLARLFGRR